MTRSSSARSRGYRVIGDGARSRPIMFRAPLVRSILGDAKFQTRRVMDQPPPHFQPSPLRHEPRHDAPYFDAYNHGDRWCWWSRDNRQGPGWVRCPFGVVGDRLWCKEPWGYAPGTTDAERCVVYRASVTAPPDWPAYRGAYDDYVAWRSSRFMPRWASRLELEITRLRAQRLWQIDEADARAEGCTGRDDDVHSLWKGGGQPSARAQFIDLWDSIHGDDVDRAWASNPWVWVIDFVRVQPAAAADAAAVDHAIQDRADT